MFDGYVDGCNCCENAKIDLSNYAEICEGQGNIQVPCSCLNHDNKVSACSCTQTSDCVHYHTCMRTIMTTYVYVLHIKQ